MMISQFDVTCEIDVLDDESTQCSSLEVRTTEYGMGPNLPKARTGRKNQCNMIKFGESLKDYMRC
jgi:hypothetical protein